MRVEVAHAGRGVEACVAVELDAGAVVADAVARSDLPRRLRLDPATLSYAIHGQRAHPDTPVADGDRVELLLPLVMDAGLARRRRAALQRQATAREPAPKAGKDGQD